MEILEALNLGQIDQDGFWYLVGVYAKAWITCHIVGLCIFSIIKAAMPAEHKKLGNAHDEKGPLKVGLSIYAGYLSGPEVLYIALRPLVLTDKNKIVIAALITWYIAKFC